MSSSSSGASSPRKSKVEGEVASSKRDSLAEANPVTWSRVVIFASSTEMRAYQLGNLFCIDRLR